MIQALILDDNDLERESLKQLIHQLSPNFHLFEASTTKECLDYLNKTRIDVLFLDIELEENTSFELVNQLKDKDSPLIVYVTNYPKYTKQCFGYKVIKFIEKKEVKDVLPQVLKEIESYFKDQLNVYTYTSKSLLIEVPYHQIVSFVRDGDYVEMTYFYNNELKKDYLDTSIKKLEETLSDDFIKVSQSVILNTDHIKEMTKSTVISSNQEVYALSRSLRKDVISKYHHKMMNKRIIY